MNRFTALANKFIRYLMVGACNTALCLSVMYIGARFGLNYLVYTALGYVCSTAVSFFMNLRYTFRVNGAVGQRLALFCLVNLVNLVLVEIIEYVLVESYGLTRLIAIFCGMCWFVVTGFLANNYFVYRERAES